MFEGLKKSIKDSEILTESYQILSEMSEGGAPEDAILEEIVLSDKEDNEIKKFVDKIPDGPIGNTEDISDKDLNDAAAGVPDPTIDELLNDNMFEG